MSDEPCCDGVSVINEKLKEFNHILVTNLFGPPRIALATCKLRDSVRTKRPPIVMASFCPFCGKKAP